jgi:hypothetical protein
METRLTQSRQGVAAVRQSRTNVLQATFVFTGEYKNDVLPATSSQHCVRVSDTSE